jgi:hypothetical protein
MGVFRPSGGTPKTLGRDAPLKKLSNRAVDPRAGPARKDCLLLSDMRFSLTKAGKAGTGLFLSLFASLLVSESES